MIKTRPPRMAARPMIRQGQPADAELTLQSIHDQLDVLDPVTRAAVFARFTSDEVKKVRDHSPDRRPGGSQAS